MSYVNVEPGDLMICDASMPGKNEDAANVQLAAAITGYIQMYGNNVDTVTSIEIYGSDPDPGYSAVKTYARRKDVFRVFVWRNDDENTLQ